MKRNLLHLGLLVFVLLSGYWCAESKSLNPQTKPEKKPTEKPLHLTSYLVLISIDGLRIEDLQNAKLNLPTLRWLRERGTTVLSVESVYPSQSLPAHATILTGMYPSDHGVYSDAKTKEKDDSAAAIKPSTILQVAKRSGVKIGASNFPFSKGEAVDFNLQNLNATLAAAEKNPPQLLLLRFEEIANSIQQFGLGSVEAQAALISIDESLKSLVESIERAGLTNEITYLIVSSHGFAKVQQEFRPNVILAKKGRLTLDAKGNIASWEAMARTFGGAAAIYLKDANDEVKAKEVQAIFAEVHKNEASPIWRVISRQDAAKLGADPQAAFFIEAAPGFIFSEQAAGKKITEKLGKDAIQAVSGYSPSRSEMRGILIGSGKGIRPQTTIEYARLIDLAPTMARLLGLELKPTRGHAISEMILPTNPK